MTIIHLNLIRFDILLLLFISFTKIHGLSQVFGRYGSVRVDIDATVSETIDKKWASGWPEGIRLSSNMPPSLPSALRFTNVSGYPYSISLTKNRIDKQTIRSKQLFTYPRTFLWKTEEELQISCKLSSASTNPSCTRIAPPLSWLQHLNMKVFPVGDDDGVEIIVSKARVEATLGYLSGLGMTREEIFRMLDKGPWILAFDLSSSLPKLVQDLHASFGFNSTECRHVITHCPFLLAQYSRFKGRDIVATSLVLSEVQYSESTLIEDVRRFPAILTAPPERLRGWLSLLQQYGVALNVKHFGKMLRRASYMFYRDPPSIFEDSDQLNQSYEYNRCNPASKKSDVIVSNAKTVLDMLLSYNIPDMDKVVRTDPFLLLTAPEELQHRINFLLALYSIENNGNIIKNELVNDESGKQTDENTMTATDMFGYTSAAWISRGDGLVNGENDRNHEQQALELLHSLLQTYPRVLSIDHKQMRNVGNALRSSGLKQSEVVALIKMFPFVLSKSPEIIQNLFLFLKSYCGFHRSDIFPAITKNPLLLSVDIESLKPKVDYFYQSIGGSSALLRRCPNYLCYDLDEHIKPRIEFVKAFNHNPLVMGVSQILKASPNALAQAVKVDTNIYRKFIDSYSSFKKKSTSSI